MACGHDLLGDGIIQHAGLLALLDDIRYSMFPSGPLTGLKSNPRTTKPFAAA